MKDNRHNAEDHNQAPRAGQQEHSESSERSGKPEQPVQPERSGRPEKPARSEQPSGDTREVNTDFMKEEIRQRPINRRRLLRRTFITFLMAVLFGAVACVVFLLLEPVINSALYPAEEPQEVSFTEDVVEDEMSPEDMIVDDQQIQEAAAEEIAANSVESITQEVLEEVQGQLEQEVQKQIEEGAAAADSTGEETLDGSTIYAAIAESLSAFTQTAQKSMVTVTAITPDYDWVGDSFNNTDSVSGLIVADRGTDLLILADDEGLSGADEIRITFHDGQQIEAQMICLDPVTELVILSVDIDAMDSAPEENEEIAVCTLGNSTLSGRTGDMIAALGSPTGLQGSVNYGFVTNADAALDITDGAYVQITTDIYGSTAATGVLMDSGGAVVGWIDMDHNSSDSPNLISAIGISTLKALVENMSNEVSAGYLGIHGTDVPDSVGEEQGIPGGAYVLRTELDSPAMEAGIQSGDVIVSLNGNEITSYEQVVDILERTNAGRYLSVTVMRPAQEGYQEVDLTVRLTQRFTLPEED